MRFLAVTILVVSSPTLARAQQPQSPPASGEWVAPPLVDAPESEPKAANREASPAAPAPTTAAPQGAPSMPHPPSAQSHSEPPSLPGLEIGLMASESLFGMLTAAGSGLLLYYLVLKNLTQLGAAAGGSEMQTLSTVVFLLGFSAVPLAVAQTEVQLANGSHYFSSESWPASLSGLGAQAAVLGLYYLMKGSLSDGGEALLLVGTCIGVPLAEMAVINLTKTPRWKLPGGGFKTSSLITVGERGEVGWGLPVPRPAILPRARGPELGAQLSLASGTF